MATRIVEFDGERVTVCRCEKCLSIWVTRGDELPRRCGNSKHRHRDWNGGEMGVPEAARVGSKAIAAVRGGTPENSGKSWYRPIPQEKSGEVVELRKDWHRAPMFRWAEESQEDPVEVLWRLMEKEQWKPWVGEPFWNWSKRINGGKKAVGPMAGKLEGMYLEAGGGAELL